MANQLASFLEQMGDEDRPVRSLDLTAVSDLSRAQVQEFRAGWDTLRPARRIELMTVMVEQAETDIHLNFHAALRACLTDDTVQIRQLAIEGLWEDERVNLIRPLVGLLANDPASEVRAAAAISLGRFVLLGVLGDIAEEPAEEAAEALRAAWHRASEPISVRRRALEGLSHTDAPDLRDLISSAYYDDDALMRQSALFAMGRNANPRWNKIVLAELNSRDAAIRFEAAGAAGEMALRAAVQPLIQRLDDPDQDVREAAALALGKIGGLAARRALERLVGGDDERLAEAAEEALTELSFSSERLDDVPLNYSGDPRSPRHGSRSQDDDLVDFVDEDDFDGEDSGWDDEDDRDGDDDEDGEFSETDEDWDDDTDDEDDLDWEDEAWDEDEPDMG